MFNIMDYIECYIIQILNPILIHIQWIFKQYSKTFLISIVCGILKVPNMEAFGCIQYYWMVLNHINYIELIQLIEHNQLIHV